MRTNTSRLKFHHSHSDEMEWDAVVFELEVNLERAWKYHDKMDIV
jgi:hypothetical protein